MLRSEDVQAEIDVNDAQGATITAALEAYREERDAARPDFSSFRDLSEEERTAAFAKMRKDGEALNKKTDEMLNALLEPDQIKRLDEIALQLKVRMALTATLKSDELKSKLSVSEDQLRQLDEAEKANSEAQDKMREEMRASFGGRGRGEGDGGEAPDREKVMAEMRKKGEEARAEATKKIMAVLTADQQATLKKLQGEEFEVDMRSLMGGRGGAGGRGGDGGRGGEAGRGQGGRGRGDGGGQQPRRRHAADSDDAI